MAIRGVYTEEEKKMLARFEETAEEHSGWFKSLLIPVATRESIKSFALAVDPWNPLWHDDNYAAKTRWGGIIAPPMYLDAISQFTWYPEMPPSLGYRGGQWLGEDWELFKPICMNDSFKVWRRRHQMEDITSLDGKGPRTFKCIAHDTDVINQKDELLSTLKLYLEIVIFPEPPEKEEPIPEYIYTKEELALIDRIFKEEEIRGAKIRWWEDVKVGEELKPVVMGPTTLWDQIVYTAGRQELELVPMMEVRRKGDMLVLDPVTGVTHHGIEWHHSDLVAQLWGMPNALHYGIVSRQLLARCVTNWMGDDGFIRKFHWRHLSHFKIGDTCIGRGKVTGKRTKNGEHLVDISLWTENLRGHVSIPAVATVSLLSKGASFTWK